MPRLTSRSTPATRSPGGPWPTGPLDAAQRAFELLTCPPAPLLFDGHDLSGMRDRALALDELKRLLIADTTSRTTRDLVWADLVTRARRDGPAWVVGAVGIAMPGLRRKAGKLAPGWHGDSDDLDSELLTGFLERLPSIDIGAPNICQRLIDAGARAVHRSRRCNADPRLVQTDSATIPTPMRVEDHPDFVLARAVAAAVIGPEECHLIIRTRLERIPLTRAAEEIGIAVSTAAAWRRRAEHLLAASLRAGELVSW